MTIALLLIDIQNDYFPGGAMEVVGATGAAVRRALQETLNKARRIVDQSGQRKAADGQPKLYAWHAPEVDYISKGKARTPYEFGVKVGVGSWGFGRS